MAEKSYSKLNLTLINNLKRKIEELKKSEENYRGLFDNAVDAIFVADTVTRQVVDCNKSAEKLMGYSRDKILSMKADELHSKELRKKTMEGFKKQAEGKIKSIFSDVLTKDNKRIPVEISASGINIGNEHYIQAIFRDISEKKKAENNLKESEEKYRAIVENATDWIFVLDKKCKFLSLNKSVANLFRMPAEKVIGKSIFEMFPKKITLQFLKNNESVFKTGKSKFIEEKMIIGNREFWINTTLNPIKDNKGKVTAVMGITKDITERKEAEEKIKESEEKYKKEISELKKRLNKKCN